MDIYRYGLFEDVSENIHSDRIRKSDDYYKRYISEDKKIIMKEYILPDSYKMEEHFHDWLEFTLVVKGKQHIFIKEKEYVLTDGDILMINYNDIHYSYTDHETQKLTIQFKAGYIEKLIPEFDAKKISCSSTNILSKYDQLTYLNIVHFFVFLFRSFTRTAPHIEADFYGYLYLLIYNIMKDCVIKEDKSNHISEDNYVNQLLSYLNRHYSEDITLQTLSDIFHLTPQYISKIIKEEIGKGFKEYLVQLRLEQAAFLIQKTDKNLLSISEECGFSNYKSFIYYFKQYYKISPFQYKKTIK